MTEQFHLKSTFARTFGWSLGSEKSADLDQQVKGVLQSDQIQKANHIHIWQRDTRVPGSGGFEPGETVLATQAGEKVAAAVSEQLNRQLPVNRNAKVDDLVFDIVLVEPDHWWFGYHYSNAKFQRWPGGVPKFDLNSDVVSRAYFKLKEALLWSGIRIQAADVCAEIGSSPGGACQFLLEKGAKVIAIDPAEMDPEIVKHENLTHLRCRGKEVRKKELNEVRWLIADVSATPTYTLDAIEPIVSNQRVTNIRGLVLTLKLSDWKLAAELPAWHKRVKELGFQIVKTRQLAFNKREICLVAIRDKFALRSSKRK